MFYFNHLYDLAELYMRVREHTPKFTTTKYRYGLMHYGGKWRMLDDLPPLINRPFFDRKTIEVTMFYNGSYCKIETIYIYNARNENEKFIKRCNGNIPAEYELLHNTIIRCVHEKIAMCYIPNFAYPRSIHNIFRDYHINYECYDCRGSHMEWSYQYSFYYKNEKDYSPIYYRLPINGKFLPTTTNYDNRHLGYKYEEVFQDKDYLLHREDGPAVVYYNRDGSIQSCRYFLNGKETDKNGRIIF